MTDIDEPVGYLALPRGTPVVTSDGVTVGKVHTVKHHERERIFDGLVVQTGEGTRFVDAPEVGHLTRRQADLLIDRAAFAALPGADGIVDSLDSTVRRAARRLRRRLPGR